MNLLFLIHRLPCPPDRGVKLRSAVELRWLAARHNVWCAGFIEEMPAGPHRDAAERSLAECRTLCRGFEAVPLRPILAAGRAGVAQLTGRTATEGYFSSPHLTRTVTDWAETVAFDAVLASSSSMAPLALRVPAARRVLDLVDLDSRKWAALGEECRSPMGWVYRTEAVRLERCERDWIKRFDASILVNAREADLLGSSALRNRVHVIETGAGIELPAGADTELPDEPVVGLIGAMDYAPNIEAATWFAESMWPRIRQCRPDARWLIVGRSPARRVQRLHDGEAIHVTGTVPAVEPYLRQMRVSIAPLRLARGVQTKVLAAMAAGRPCVVTSCVAEGVGARAGEELLVGDEPAAFANAVIDLLNDRARAGRIGAAGRAFVDAHYRADAALERIERLLTAA